MALVFIAAFLTANTAQAGPIFITRGILIHPIYTRSPADSGGFLTRTGMWGGVQKGFGSEGERFAWLLDVGAVIELWQWERSSLLAISGMQLNADPHNEISFNPTGVTWEEHLVYATRGEGANWQLGFAQRCRHDVDNLDIKEATGEAQQRTLIYSSITGKAILPRFKRHGITTDVWAHGDLYVISQDYRLPKHTDTAQPNIERLATSFGGTAELSFSDPQEAGLYFNLAATFSLYGSESGLFRKFETIDRLRGTSRGELGYRIPARGGNFRIFAGFERFADDGIMPIPKANEYFFIGFRFTGKELTL